MIYHFNVNATTQEELINDNFISTYISGMLCLIQISLEILKVQKEPHLD